MKPYHALVLLAGLAGAASAQRPDFSTGQAARLVIGQVNFTISDYGASSTLLGAPSGIALANGMLFVADANRYGATPVNNRVLIFKDASTYPSPTQPPDRPGSGCPACVGNASVVLGQPDFSSTTIALTANGMRTPTAVASDGNVVVVADTDNNRVLIWRSIPTTNGQPADVVIGQPDFTHNATAVPPTARSLRGPQGVWIQNGKLFIADTQDDRILIYNQIPASNNAAADVVLGQPDFNTFVQGDISQQNAPPTPRNMITPVAATSDGRRLYVTDLGQNRIMVWNSIPTSNNAPADLAVGQPDLVSAVSNNNTRLCASNGTDSSNNPTYPAVCAATLSFPRFALSDGIRLLVADGGNDRVLVFTPTPLLSGAHADTVIGQPDEFTVSASINPDGTNAFETPSSLAWDGTNLYVSDTFNRRVVVYSRGQADIPLDGVRNAASLEIYAIGSVTLGGTITENDTATITIGAKDYKYTVKKTDTLEDVTTGLTSLINASPGDPNVTAIANTTADLVQLTARVGGQPGGSVTLTTTVSTNATITATASDANLSIFLKDPAKIAPGTLIGVYGQNFTDGGSASGDFSRPYLPTSLAGAQVYIDGLAAPLLYASPTQMNVQMPYETVDRTSVSLYVRTAHSDGSVTVTTPVAVTIVPQNPGIFAAAGTDPRPGYVFHGSSYAVGAISVDGTITANNVATITIGSNTYNYTVRASDTLASIRDALISLINASDPVVNAYATNLYTRIILLAKTPGKDGEGTAYSTSVSSGATLILSALGSTVCCSSAQGTLVTDQNPAVPGETLYVFATGLGPTNPSDIDTGRVYPGGEFNPPAVPVDSILAGGSTANQLSVSPVQGMVGIYFVQFQLNSSLPTNPSTQLTIAQQEFISNVVTFPIVAP